MKILASYQSYLKNSKIAILKTKALEEINKTPLLDKSYTIIENNDSFGVFGALINTLNVTYYDIKITEVKDNLVTFSLDANKISNITNSTTSSTLYITFDTSYMLPTYIKVDNFTSNGKIKDIFNLPLELNNSNIEIEIRYKKTTYYFKK